MKNSTCRITPLDRRSQSGRLSYRRAAVGVLWGLVLLGLSGTAAVAADYDKVSRQVAYGDLNLATAAGRDALMHRIQQAATAVCGGPTASRDLHGIDSFHACRDEALAAAMPIVQAAIDGASTSTRVAINTSE